MPLRIPKASTISSSLRGLGPYLGSFLRQEQSTAFEKLASQAFASLLHLPFYDSSTDDPNVAHRLYWGGSESSGSRAPAGPDAIAYAHDFAVVIAATMKEGKKQWSQEFIQSLTHTNDFAERQNIPPQKLHSVWVTTCIHPDTYAAIKAHNPGKAWKIALMETDVLADIVETSGLAFTMRHIEFAQLLRDMVGRLSDSSTLTGYRAMARSDVNQWTTRVLELEKCTTIAVKSYQALLASQRSVVAASDVLLELNADRVLQKYLGKLSATLDSDLIGQSLRQESLAAQVQSGIIHDNLYVPVPLCDFESRCERRREAVRAAAEGN